MSGLFDVVRCVGPLGLSMDKSASLFDVLVCDGPKRLKRFERFSAASLSFYKLPVAGILVLL